VSSKRKELGSNNSTSASFAAFNRGSLLNKMLEDDITNVHLIMSLYIASASAGYTVQILTAFIKKNFIGKNALLASEIPRTSCNDLHHVSAATLRDSMTSEIRVEMISLTLTFTSIDPFPS
jgi:hypothetical protein